MKIRLLTVPYDSGFYRKRMGEGPVKLCGSVIRFLQSKDMAVETDEVNIEDHPFAPEVMAGFELNKKLSALVSQARSNNEFPVILSGNCNSAIGTVAGIGKKTGIIWMDCHGDFNTPETTEGGFFDGMALAVITGRCWVKLAAQVPGFIPAEEKNVCLIGARDLDESEAEALSDSEIKVWRTDSSFPPETMPSLLPLKVIYLHIDLDILDPSYIRANGYATTGGLSPDQLFAYIVEIKNHYQVEALSFTAYDPQEDPDYKMEAIVNGILSIVFQPNGFDN